MFLTEKRLFTISLTGKRSHINVELCALWKQLSASTYVYIVLELKYQIRGAARDIILDATWTKNILVQANNWFMLLQYSISFYLHKVSNLGFLSPALIAVSVEAVASVK